GFSKRHINKLTSVRFKILSVFSPTSLSIILTLLGHPIKIQVARISREARLIPPAILKSIVAIIFTSVSLPEAYLTIESRFLRAVFKLTSAISLFGTTDKIVG